jgi:hypothetical protein
VGEARRLLSGLRRESLSILRADSPTHRHLRDRLLTAAIATVLVDLVATLVVFFSERHAPNTEIRTIGSAAFWTSAQLLTVSSNLQNPISSAARVVDVVLEVYAITVVTALAGAFGAFFHRRGLERDPLEPASAPGRRPGDSPTG